jgi:hypothetical protein
VTVTRTEPMILDRSRSQKVIAKALGIDPSALESALRPALEEDLEGVLALRRLAYGSAPPWDEDRYFRWRYRLGPRPCRGSELWVASHGGTLYGCIGVEPVTLVLDGAPLAAGSLIDLAVDPQFDRLGIGVWLNLSLAERFSLVFTSGGNANSRRIIDRLFIPLANRRTFVYPIRSASIFRASARLRAFRFAGPLLDGVAELTRRAHRPRGTAELSTQPIVRFDERVDALSDADTRDAGLTVLRRHGHLNWRFLENPRVNYSAIGVFRGDELCAYAVYRISTTPAGLRELWVVDLLMSGPRAHAALHLLMHAAIRKAREHGAASVRVAAYDPRMAHAFKREGFLDAARSHQPLSALTANAGLRTRLEIPSLSCRVSDIISDHDGA